MNKELISKGSSFILNEIKALENPESLNKIIKSLTPEDLNQQKQLITQYLSIISIPTQINQIPKLNDILKQGNQSNFSILTENIVKKESSLLKSTPQIISSIQPLSNSSIAPTIQSVDISSSLAKRSQEINSLLNSLQKSYPEIKNIKSEKINDLSEKMIEKARGQILQLNYLLNNSPEKINSYFEKLSNEEKNTILAIITLESSSIKNSTSNQSQISQFALSSQLFDKALLIQKQPNILGKSKLSDLSKIPNQTSEAKKNAVISIIKSQLLSLQKQRAILFPELIKTIKPAALQIILKKIKPSKLTSIQKSFDIQIKLLNKPDLLKANLNKIDSNERYISQLLLNELLSRIKAPKLLAAVLKPLNFKGSLSENILSKKLLTNLYLAQKKKFKKGFKLLPKTKRLTNDQLINQEKVELEMVERHKINSCLMRSISAILKSNPKLIKFSQDKSGTSALKVVYTPEEIDLYHSYMKSFLAINGKSTDVISIINDKDPKEILRLLYCILNLSTLITPKKTVTNQSLLKKTINSDKINLSSTNNDIIPPTQPEIYGMLVQATTSLVNSIQALSNIPINECKIILNNENSHALTILSKLFDSKSTLYNPEIEKLVELSPQLVASITRVFTSLDKKIRSELINDPTKIINLIADIHRNSINLSDSESLIKYRSSITDLLIILKKIESAISNNLEIIKIDPIECAANLTRAIDNKDLISINNELIKFETAKIQSIILGQNNKQITTL